MLHAWQRYVIRRLHLLGCEPPFPRALVWMHRKGGGAADQRATLQWYNFGIGMYGNAEYRIVRNGSGCKARLASKHIASSCSKSPLYLHVATVLSVLAVYPAATDGQIITHTTDRIDTHRTVHPHAHHVDLHGGHCPINWSQVKHGR